MGLPKIALIGAGQIGSRHLQALALINREIALEVVDPSQHSLDITKERFAEVSRTSYVKSIRFLTELDNLSNMLDVVVVATNADVRRAVLEKLLDNKKVKYLLLEKVLFQRIEDYHAIGELMELKGVRAWVNCGRRMWPIYKTLKNKLNNNPKINYSISGSKIGLGCNSIHFLDTLAYLSRESEFKLKFDQLDSELVTCKRPGFVEFTGTLYGVSKKGSTLSITSYSEGNAPVVVTINSSELCCIVKEGIGRTWISERSNNWQWEELIFDIPMQSRSTHLVIQQILDEGECGLPGYKESAQLHLPILSTLLEHYKYVKEEETTICPIT
ncbi:MAG: hypothetical protein APF81_00340 [Desulfosporosinus sp. BRH_c37]|nr:MAG: hypothetical protein APF81_00340 [Desulfosporosinus sp. BRH_c37]